MIHQQVLFRFPQWSVEHPATPAHMTAQLALVAVVHVTEPLLRRPLRGLLGRLAERSRLSVVDLFDDTCGLGVEKVLTCAEVNVARQVVDKVSGLHLAEELTGGLIADWADFDSAGVE